jgi:hypothetical protein
MGDLVPLFGRYAPVYCVCPDPIVESLPLFDAVQCGVCKRPFKIVGDASTREGEDQADGVPFAPGGLSCSISDTFSPPVARTAVVGDSEDRPTPSGRSSRDQHPSAWRKTKGE